MNRKQQQVIEYLLEENRVLGEQLGRKRLSFSDEQKRRLAAKAKGITFGRLKEIARAASPQTLMRWYRALLAKKYDGTRNRGPGRPLTAPELTDLVVRLAKENRGWGYTRIQGALAHLGHEIGRTTLRQSERPATRIAPFGMANRSPHGRFVRGVNSSDAKRQTN
jgi:transposase-like protein